VFSLLSLIAQQYRIMLFIRSQSGKIDSYEIARQMEVNPFFAKKCMAVANTFSLNALKGIINKISALDVSLKSGLSLLPNLELLIVELCNN
jgi:DNA polymerase III delta subunit